MTPTPAKKAVAKKKPVSVVRATPAATATVFTDRRIALLVTFLALVVGALAAASVAGLTLTKSNNDVLEIVKDSVDPGGKRFQRGQEQTAAAVGAINEITILAAYCAKASTDLSTIQGCVRAEYARMHPETAAP